jgi:hypothetical protein
MRLTVVILFGVAFAFGCARPPIPVPNDHVTVGLPRSAFKEKFQTLPKSQREQSTAPPIDVVARRFGLRSEAAIRSFQKNLSIPRDKLDEAIADLAAFLNTELAPPEHSAILNVEPELINTWHILCLMEIVKKGTSCELRVLGLSYSPRQGPGWRWYVERQAVGCCPESNCDRSDGQAMMVLLTTAIQRRSRSELTAISAPKVSVNRAAEVDTQRCEVIRRTDYDQGSIIDASTPDDKLWKTVPLLLRPEALYFTCLPRGDEVLCVASHNDNDYCIFWKKEKNRLILSNILWHEYHEVDPD